MNIISAATLTIPQKEAIIRIWNSEYPRALQHATISSFDDYLEKLANKLHYLVTDLSGGIHGWAVLFDRDGGRWFAVILDSQIHGQGMGTRLMEELKKEELELNGWVIDANTALKENGEIYRSPMSFYLKNGFRVKPGERFENEKMSAVKITWKRARETS